MALSFTLRLRRTLNALSTLHCSLSSTTPPLLTRSLSFRSTTIAPFRSSLETKAADTANSGRRINEFDIAFSSRYCASSPDFRLEWYSIKVQVPDLDPESPSYSSTKETKHEKPLHPFSVVRMVGIYSKHEYIAPHLYSIGGLHFEGDIEPAGSLDMNRFNKPHRLDLNCPDAGWEALPPMTFPDRLYPKSVVLDGKLYVMGSCQHDGEFRLEEAEAKGYGWMEVYDPILNTWEPLPNPPSGFGFDYTFAKRIVYTALPFRKQILVSQKYDGEATCFLIFDVNTRCWTTLVPPTKLARYHDKRPTVVGNTIYWANIYGRRDDEHIFIKAYNLDTDVWFRGTAKIGPFFSDQHEFLSKEEDTSSRPLLHLVDQKFCIFLHSSLDEMKSDEVNLDGYFNCLIIDLAQIFEHNYEKCTQSFSIDSIEKFPVVYSDRLGDSVLLNG